MAWTLSKAMAAKCESLRFSQGQVAEYSAGGCSAGGACAPWNGTSTPQACCSQGRTTDASNPSPCGTTCRPSTGDPGVDAWTWFLAASPARTSAPPARAWESKAPEAECGSTWRELWARYDRASCGWRTHRCLWDEGLDWSSLTLPRWGMMRDGVLWERATPVLRIDESGSGCWPTPRAHNAGPDFAKLERSKTGISLETSVAMWPTPNTRDWKDSGPTQGNRHSPNLGTVVSWPTPTASMITMADVEQAKYAGNKGSNRPTYQEAKQAGPGNGGQLNPDWVELLMGWPLGWTRTDGSRPDVDGWRGAHAGGVPWGEGTAWERGVPRVAAKIPNRVGRLKCIGNGQVPAAMRLAWESLRNNRRDIHEML